MPPMHSSTIHIKDTCRNASLGNGGFNRTPWTPSTLFRNLLVAKIMNHLLTVLRAPFPICTQPLEISLVCDSNRTIVELLKLNFQHGTQLKILRSIFATTIFCQSDNISSTSLNIEKTLPGNLFQFFAIPGDSFVVGRRKVDFRPNRGSNLVLRTKKEKSLAVSYVEK